MTRVSCRVSQSLDDQDLPDRAHRDARHQDPEAVGGVPVQGLGDGRHHLHEWEGDELGERSRQERPAQDTELAEEPSCVAEARSMGRWRIVQAGREHRDDSQQRQIAERGNQEHRRDADHREQDPAQRGAGDARHAHRRGIERHDALEMLARRNPVEQHLRSHEDERGCEAGDEAEDDQPRHVGTGGARHTGEGQRTRELRGERADEHRSQPDA